MSRRPGGYTAYIRPGTPPDPVFRILDGTPSWPRWSVLAHTNLSGATYDHLRRGRVTWRMRDLREIARLPGFSYSVDDLVRLLRESGRYVRQDGERHGPRGVIRDAGQRGRARLERVS